jgi:hypothetical protein
MKPSKEVKITSLHNNGCGTFIEKVEALGENPVVSFANGDDEFFQEKAISNYPVQEIRFSGRVHFIPILKETP